MKKANWEDEFDKEFGHIFDYIEANTGENEREEVKDFIKNHFVEANEMVVDK